jgi:hypothetical protein
LNGATGGTSHRGRDAGPRRGGSYTDAATEKEIFDSVWDD